MDKDLMQMQDCFQAIVMYSIGMDEYSMIYVYKDGAKVWLDPERPPLSLKKGYCRWG